MALDPKCFIVQAEEIDHAGDNFIARAVFSLVGRCRKSGDIDAMRNLATTRRSLCKRIRKSMITCNPKAKRLHFRQHGGHRPSRLVGRAPAEPKRLDHVGPWRWRSRLTRHVGA